jgi:3-dehydroquinate synthase
VKIALLTSPDFLDDVRLETRSDALTNLTVVRAIEAKLSALADDPGEERHLDRVLNFGHCLGHPAESASRFTLLHGEAVAIGMSLALAIGLTQGDTPEAVALDVVSLLSSLNLPISLPDELVDSTWVRVEDVRRVRNGPLNLVTLRDVGQPLIIRDIDRSVFDQAVAWLGRLVAA